MKTQEENMLISPNLKCMMRNSCVVHNAQLGNSDDKVSTKIKIDTSYTHNYKYNVKLRILT